MERLQKDTTWAIAAADDSIVTFEHPLTEMTLPKDLFYTTFQKVLDQFDGTDMSSFVDFYFERNPVQLTHLKYRDEDSKQDFLDWAIEEGCMPTVKEANQGEDDVVRKARLAAQRQEAADKKAAAAAAPASRELQAEKRKAKAAATDPALKPSLKIANMLGGLTKMKSKAKPPKPEKLQRATDALDAEVAAFLASFPDRLHLLPLDLVPEEHKEGVAAHQAAVAAEKEAAAAAKAAAAAAAAAAKKVESAAAAAAAESPAPEEPTPPRKVQQEVTIAMDSSDEESSDDDSSDDDGSSSDEEE